MTPGARLSAAIELYQAITDGRDPADRLLTNWARKHRYAGSKDRRAVADLVYGTLRRAEALSWRLARQNAAATPRLMVLAASGLAVSDLAAYASERFSPPAPDAAEAAALTALADPAPADMPDWAVAGYPCWLDASLRRRFGDRTATEMAAMAGRAPVDLRANLLKTTRDAALAQLAAKGIAARPTARSPHGLRLDAHDRLDELALLREGLVEPQDEAAQLCALLVGAEPGMQVVDYCAGAGGKALALAALMRNKGQVYALDRDPRRLQRLGPRAQRAGARNIQARPIKADDPWLAELAGRCDRVLVDAPCSGTGTWRRNPEARFRLTPDMLAAHTRRQDQVLRDAADLVRPGGRLVYATCSLLPEENEDRVAAFLADHPDFAVLPIARIWDDAWGPCPGDPYLALSPASHDTDGFFTAVLTRQP